MTRLLVRYHIFSSAHRAKNIEDTKNLEFLCFFIRRVSLCVGYTFVYFWLFLRQVRIAFLVFLLDELRTVIFFEEHRRNVYHIPLPLRNLGSRKLDLWTFILSFDEDFISARSNQISLMFAR